MVVRGCCYALRRLAGLSLLSDCRRPTASVEAAKLSVGALAGFGGHEGDGVRRMLEDWVSSEEAGVAFSQFDGTESELTFLRCHVDGTCLVVCARACAVG